MLCLLVGLWASCGGGGSSSGGDQVPLTGIQDRVFVNNTYTGVMEIINAQTYKVSTTTITIGGSPQKIFATPDKRHMVMFDSTYSAAAFVSSDTESRPAKITLPSFTESLAIKPDGSTGYAALRNTTVTGNPPGAIAVLDPTNNVISSQIPVPNVHWIFIDNAGKRLLAFSDTTSTIYSVDLTASTLTATPLAGTYDKPVYAIFSSDDSKAYILNCGAECGGTESSVTEYTFSNNTTRTTLAGTVPAATIGSLNGTTLYVAGAPNGVGGKLTAIDTGTMTASAPVDIGSGYHQVMKFGGDKLWIGAKGCGNTGCLSVYNPGDKSVVVDTQTGGAAQRGDVTGMEFITSDNQMWVCEGGEVNVYDLGVNLQTPQFDVVGQASDLINPPAAPKK